MRAGRIDAGSVIMFLSSQNLENISGTNPREFLFFGQLEFVNIYVFAVVQSLNTLSESVRSPDVKWVACPIFTTICLFAYLIKNKRESYLLNKIIIFNCSFSSKGFAHFCYRNKGMSWEN